MLERDMKTGLLLSDHFTAHDPGDHHPESPTRIRAILRELESSGLPAKCRALSRRTVTDDEIRLVHTDAYLKTALREKFSDYRLPGVAAE